VDDANSCSAFETDLKRTGSTIGFDIEFWSGRLEGFRSQT